MIEAKRPLHIIFGPYVRPTVRIPSVTQLLAHHKHQFKSLERCCMCDGT